MAASLWPDAVYGTFGYTSGAFVAIYGASWYLKERPPARDETGFGFRVDGQVAYWLGKGQPTPYQHVWDFSVTPVARWTFDWPSAPGLFVEGGIGFHGLSATRINNDRMFGTAFQFGEMVGSAQRLRGADLRAARVERQDQGAELGAHLPRDLAQRRAAIDALRSHGH
jgi:lipid A 3-O-deacylase PagL